MWKTYSGDVDVLAKRASDGANSPGKKREECGRTTVVGVEGGGRELHVMCKRGRPSGARKSSDPGKLLASKKERDIAGHRPGFPFPP